MVIKQTRLRGIRGVYRILLGKHGGMRELRDLNVDDNAFPQSGE